MLVILSAAKDLCVRRARSFPFATLRASAHALRMTGRIARKSAHGKSYLQMSGLRVDALIASGDGERFDPRHDGRLMKEWVSVEPTFEEEWLPLAREAMEFVASQH